MSRRTFRAAFAAVLRRLALISLPFAALAVLECGLRVYVAVREKPTPTSASSAREILCAGDSNTEGAGAPQGRGYPEQLEERVGAEYTVVNLGRSGSNSTQAAQAVEERVRSGRAPRFVLFLSGNNDNWNLTGVDPALARLAGMRPFAAVRWAQRLRTFQLMRGLALRLFRRLHPLDPSLAYAAKGDWRSLKRDLDAKRVRTKSDDDLLAVSELQLGDFSAAAADFRRYAASSDEDGGVRLGPVLDPGLIQDELDRLGALQENRAPGDLFKRAPVEGRLMEETVLYFLGRGWCRLAQGRYDAARTEFEGLLRSPRASPSEKSLALNGIAWSYLREGSPAAALPWFERAASLGYAPTPQDDAYWSFLGGAIAAHRTAKAELSRRMLASARQDAIGQQRESPQERCWLERAQEEIEGGRAAAVQCGTLPPVSYLMNRQHALAAPRMDFPAQILEQNVRGLAELAAERGFTLVLLTYPQEVDSEINRRVRAMSAERALPLIDLQREFALAAPASADVYSSDGYHPNEKGYGIIADVVARKLAELDGSPAQFAAAASASADGSPLSR